MLHELKCEICGGTFYSVRKNAVTCSEICRRKRQAIKREENRKLYETQKSEKEKKMSIDEINKIARSQGLSYGKFKAMEYIRNNNL